MHPASPDKISVLSTCKGDHHAVLFEGTEAGALMHPRWSPRAIDASFLSGFALNGAGGNVVEVHAVRIAQFDLHFNAQVLDGAKRGTGVALMGHLPA